VQLIIGRTQGDLIIPDSGLSGRHLQFFREAFNDHSERSQILVQDLESKNRTAVNRSEIIPQQKILLKNNDFIEAGAQHFIVTNKNALSISEVNAIIGPYLNKKLVVFENVQVIQSLKEKILAEINHNLTRQSALEADIEKNQKVLQNFHEETLKLQSELKLKMQQIDEEKNRITKEIDERIKEFNSL